jgi:glucans biosynthesis protein C
MRPLRYEGPIQRERLHYLDWLRVLAVVGVFYAHTADIFDTFYWHIKGVEQNTDLLVLVVFGTEWGMTLFFFLAGASAWFALASRTAGQFVSERFTRLIIPGLVGFLLLSPPLAYLVAISHSLYHGSLVQYYPYFFEHIQLSWNPQWLGAYAFHLWFLAFLFVISTLALPALLYVKRKRNLRFLSKIAAFCDRPAGLLVFVLPIALIQIALRAPFPGYQSWSDFFTWLLIFIYGFIFLGEPRFESAIQKQWKLTLFVGTTSLLIMLGASFTGVLSSWDSLSSYSVGYVLYQVLWSVVTWSWMLFALYFGMRFLNFSDNVIEYANEAVLPFYILHYPVIVVIAFLTLAWNINMGVKFLIVSTIALIATLVFYDLFIRRIKVSRWLFGMKPLHELQHEHIQEPPLNSSSSPPLSL